MHTVYFGKGRKHPVIIIDNHIYKFKNEAGPRNYWACINEIKCKCRVRCMSYGRTIRIKSSVVHTHEGTFKGDYGELIPKKVYIEYAPTLS